MVVVVELTGGLANQLFQWSAGYLLAKDYGVELVLDGRVPQRPWERGVQVDTLVTGVKVTRSLPVTDLSWRVVSRFGRLPTAAAKRGSELLPRLGAVVRRIEDAERHLAAGRSVRLRGLFQHADVLFERRSEIVEVIRPQLRKIESPEVSRMSRPYAAVHVRRGDYISVAKYADWFGACSSDYYRQSIAMLSSDLPIFATSDDPAWVADKLGEAAPGRLSVVEGTTLFTDLRLLVESSELVLSNSTFSWWAAFLGDHDTVICPEPWFNDQSRDRHLQHPAWVLVKK